MTFGCSSSTATSVLIEKNESGSSLNHPTGLCSRGAVYLQDISSHFVVLQRVTNL
jgi:hypothetical protein